MPFQGDVLSVVHRHSTRRDTTVGVRGNWWHHRSRRGLSRHGPSWATGMPSVRVFNEIDYKHRSSAFVELELVNAPNLSFSDNGALSSDWFLLFGWSEPQWLSNFNFLCRIRSYSNCLTKESFHTSISLLLQTFRRPTWQLSSLCDYYVSLITVGVSHRLRSQRQISNYMHSLYTL